MVDVVHHALIGGAGYLVAAHAGHDLAGMAFAAASVFPDLDVALMAFGKRFYLRHHQGITHSLVLAPAYAAVIAAPLAALAGWRFEVWLAALAGLVVHVGLDLTNTFRIALLSPFSARRASLDATFFVDGVALALTGGFYLAWLGLDWRGAGVAYPAAFAAYLGARVALQRWVRRRLGCEHAIPSAWNPFHFLVTWRDAGAVRTALHDALTGRTTDERVHPAAAPEARALAEQSPVYRDLKGILRALEITGVERDRDGVTVHARDLAVRNFGGRFGRTTLRFGAGGRLVDERAAI